MKNNVILNIVDYLSNAMEREDSCEMACFVKDISGLTLEESKHIVTEFEKKYLNDPLIFENEATDFVSQLICKV